MEPSPPDRVELRPQPGPQERFAACSADIALYGGAAGGGKSYAILFEPLYHVANPHFGAVIFRRTCPEITNEGGLWDESFKLYPHVGGAPKSGDLSWRFPSGASVSFGHIQYESDVLKWHSSQIALIAFDELTTFTEHQFFYMLSRNRSTSGVRPYIRAGCNPDAASWVARLVEWWIDPSTGHAISERSGVVRWFVRDGETLRWADSRERLFADYPDLLPKSFTFVPAKLEDNLILAKEDPNYRANLMALPRVERERLLRGNWLISAAEGEWPATYFGRHLWFPDWPVEENRTCTVIAWDPSKGGDAKYGDYSAFTILVRDVHGNLWADALGSQRWPVEEAVDVGLELCRIWEPDGFVIEINTFQELIKGIFLKRAKELGVASPLYTIDNRVKKERRIARLGPYLENRLLRLKGDSTGARLLGEQLMTFPNGEHDDFPDSLEMALRTMIRLCNEKTQRPPRR
jgi:predicted phage terminase large subunit-like protein